MTTLQITLPDALAREAEQAGLLAPGQIELLLRERLRQARVDRMRAARDALAADPLPVMTATEIDAEIDAYRSAQPRAARS